MSEKNEKKEIRIDDMTYLKKGGRYIPFERFTGFPSEGIWIVYSKPGVSSKSLMKKIEADKLGELPEEYVTTRASLELRKDEVTKALLELENKAVSWNDIVNVVFETLSNPTENI